MPSEAEPRLAQESGRILSRFCGGDQQLRLTAENGRVETMAIPVAMVSTRLLIRLLAEMARGKAVALIPIHAGLTIQQAADLLGVSRSFVVKEIDAGHLPARKVGTHCRVSFPDLMACKKRVDADRQKALDSLVDLDRDPGVT